MAFRRRAPRLFRRVPGGVEVTLGAPERELIAGLFAQLRDLITTSPDDPALRRLFPPAYHLSDDVAAETEWQRLMHPELAAQRLAALDTVSGLLATDRPLTDEDMLTLMQAVNAVRLVLGTLLDVDEEHDPRRVDPEDPSAGQHHLYAWLGYMLESAIDVSRG
jgi:hypothetical protein